MKWKNTLAATTTLAALYIASIANAADTSLSGGGLLQVTFEPNDSVTYIYNFDFDSAAHEDCTEEQGPPVVVEAYEGNDLTRTTFDTYCGVVNIRVAGLNGTNTLVVGNGFSSDGLVIPGKLDIRGGSDNDTVVFSNDVDVGSLVLTLRGGDNRVRGAANAFSPGEDFTPVTSGSLTVNTTLDIDTNNGDDIVNFRALTVGGTADINVGGGDDKANIFGGGGTNSFNKVFLRLGNGDNEGSIRNTICHLCQVFGGGGSDDIFLGRVTAGIDVDVIAGGGDDTVELNNVTSGTDVNANGGAGDDCLIDNGNSATTVSNFEGCAL